MLPLSETRWVVHVGTILHLHHHMHRVQQHIQDCVHTSYSVSTQNDQSDVSTHWPSNFTLNKYNEWTNMPRSVLWRLTTRKLTREWARKTNCWHRKHFLDVKHRQHVSRHVLLAVDNTTAKASDRSPVHNGPASCTLPLRDYSPELCHL